MSEVADSERPLFPSDSLTRDIEEVEASGEVGVPGLAVEEGTVSVSFWEEQGVPGSTFSLPLATLDRKFLLRQVRNPRYFC